MDEQVILGNFVDELYYKQCNHEESDINKSPLLMSKSTSDMYHEEYDRMRQRFRIQISNFNPRTHEGYDKWAGKVDESTKISIHVPTKGTTVLSNNAADFNEFQSTYPRRVRPCPNIVPLLPAQISIHVPTKGTTK